MDPVPALVEWSRPAERTGWLIVAVSVFYLVDFLKARLLAAGLPIQTKEWVWFVLSFSGIMLGTSTSAWPRCASATRKRCRWSIQEKSQK